MNGEFIEAPFIGWCKFTQDLRSILPSEWRKWSHRHDFCLFDFNKRRHGKMHHEIPAFHFAISKIMLIFVNEFKKTSKMDYTSTSETQGSSLPETVNTSISRDWSESSTERFSPNAGSVASHVAAASASLWQQRCFAPTTTTRATHAGCSPTWK